MYCPNQSHQWVSKNLLIFSVAGIFSSAIACTTLLVEKILWTTLMIAIKHVGLFSKWKTYLWALCFLLIQETWKRVNVVHKRCFGQIIQIRGHSGEQAEKNLWSRVCKPADISQNSNFLQMFIMSLKVTLCYKNEKNELFQIFSACWFCPFAIFVPLCKLPSTKVSTFFVLHSYFWSVELISFVHIIVNHLLDGTNFLI